MEPDDKEWHIISHAITCPVCGEAEFMRSDTQLCDVEEVTCINCGARWYERNWDASDEYDE